MKKIIQLALATLAITLSCNVFAAVKIGHMAPNFKAKAVDGKMLSLKQYRGKIVVLEWTNHQCPFVRKFYDSNTMQALQKTYTQKGIIWLRIISSGKGKQGYVSPSQARNIISQQNIYASNTILDPKGKIGYRYDAKTTPHFFIINKKGRLAYQGAIDDTPSTRQSDIKAAKNYVSAALDQLLRGKKVTIVQTRPYGCSVKYK